MGSTTVVKYVNDGLSKLINEISNKPQDEQFLVTTKSSKDRNGMTKEYMTLLVDGKLAELELTNIPIIIREDSFNTGDKRKAQMSIELNKLSAEIAESLLHFSKEKTRAILRFGNSQAGTSWSIKKVYPAIKTMNRVEKYDADGNSTIEQEPISRIYLNATLDLNVYNSDKKLMYNGTTIVDLSNTESILSNDYLTLPQRINEINKIKGKSFDTSADLVSFTGNNCNESVVLRLCKIIATNTTQEYSAAFKVAAIKIRERLNYSSNESILDSELAKIAEELQKKHENLANQ